MNFKIRREPSITNPDNFTVWIEVSTEGGRHVRTVEGDLEKS